MASGAMNFQGDIAIGYSVSSSTVFPSIRYAAKLNTDPAGSGWYFDDEAIRIVRRIEYLRSVCGLNLAGIKLVMALTEEVERLRNELRFHHRT